nr:uncharacterized protein LOC111511255 [Leptinotarsa decemlineata]
MSSQTVGRYSQPTSTTLGTIANQLSNNDIPNNSVKAVRSPSISSTSSSKKKAASSNEKAHPRLTEILHRKAQNSKTIRLNPASSKTVLNGVKNPSLSQKLDYLKMLQSQREALSTETMVPPTLLR